MRLVHSFNGIHCSTNTFISHMWSFALSCVYAKRSGFEIVLYCDSTTYEILKHCPYDEIYPILTDNTTAKTKALYAQSKFIAMENEDLGNIHIDGDVFLKSTYLKELLKFYNYDCIVQSLELPMYGWGYLWNESVEAFKNCEYPEWANPQCNSMYNCGIIGFNNQELKDEYFSTYWKMVDQFKTKGIINKSVPDLIIEQQFLKDLTDKKNYKVKTLLDFHNLDDAKNIGYQHAIGVSKINNLEKIKRVVNKFDATLYNKLQELLSNLSN